MDEALNDFLDAKIRAAWEAGSDTDVSDTEYNQYSFPGSAAFASNAPTPHKPTWDFPQYRRPTPPPTPPRRRPDFGNKRQKKSSTPWCGVAIVDAFMKAISQWC